MIDFDSSLLPLSLVGTIFWIVAFIFYVRRWMSPKVGGKVERERWEMYASEHHYQFVPDPKNPKIRGAHRGVSFELQARVVEKHDRRGRVTSSKAAASLRATHRAGLPHGFRIRKSSLGLTFGSVLMGRFAIGADEAYDGLRIESDDEAAADKLLDDPALRTSILALFLTLPKAVIHERAIESDLPQLPGDLTGLDSWLDRVAAVASALRNLSPQVERPQAEGGPAPLKPMPTAAELPERRENLSSALRRLGTASSQTSAKVQASSMKLRPYEYELEVRVIGESESRLGLPTGGRLVRGQLARSPWRMEIAFPAADNALVDALKPTDVITGMALVDDLRAISQTIECTAQTPPLVVEPARKAPGAKTEGPPAAS